MAEDFHHVSDVFLGEKVLHLLGPVVDVVLRVAGALCQVKFPEPVIADHARGFAKSGWR